MAELHRRVLRFQGHKELALLAILTIGLTALASQAFADDTAEIGVDEIVGWAGDLRSTDSVRRVRAVQQLGHLPASALPGIRQRLSDTSRQIIPDEDGYDAFRYFRHAVGSRRADDMVDIAPGILPVLEERRSPVIGRAAERLLLLRSLEGIATVPAMILMGDVLALTPPMWRWERRRLIDRMGERLVPGLIALRGHEQQAVRSWARGALSQVGRAEPGQAVQEENPELLAGILTAYGEIHDMNAMTVVISFVGHADDRVRLAARNAMTSYGRNGIWQLREAMRNQLGQEADHAWGWRRTADVLYNGLDEQRLGPATAQLERGLLAMTDDPLAARQEFEALLVAAPNHPRLAELAPHYAAFAEQTTDRAERQRLLQRALWFAPEHQAASEWQTALEHAENDQYRSQGVALAVVTAVEEQPRAVTEEATEPAGSSGSDSESESSFWSWAISFLVVACVVAAMLLRNRVQSRAPQSHPVKGPPVRVGYDRLIRTLATAYKHTKAMFVLMRRKGRSLLNTLHHLAGRSRQAIKRRDSQPSSASSPPKPIAIGRAHSQPAEADAQLFFGTEPEQAEPVQTPVLFQSSPLTVTAAPAPVAAVAAVAPSKPTSLGASVLTVEDPTTLHDYVPPGMLTFDTSPGMIEAPDTLPG